MLSAIDWLGNTFMVGEKVMYCIGAGRGQMMAIGKVKQIRAKEVMKRCYDSSRGWYQEPGVDIEVQVITEKTSGHWNNEGRTKPAWVNPMNITSLVYDIIPTPKES